MAYTATAIGDWDSTKPAGTETPSVLDDALREVKACIENEIYKVGYFIRPQFKYKDADEVYIEPAVYDHRGTSDQALHWDTQLTFQFGSGGSNAASSDLTASAWHYLYIDDSAVVTLGARLLTASELLNSTTAPTWTVAKHGWYNGSDRCIGAFLTDGSSQILEFYHDGGNLLTFADQIEDLTATDIDTTWTDITLSIPGFATQALIASYMYGDVSTAGTAYWRTNGQTGTTGHILGYADDNNSEGDTNAAIAYTDTSQVIEVKVSVSSAHTVTVNTAGWFFPVGM